MNQINLFNHHPTLTLQFAYELFFRPARLRNGGKWNLFDSRNLKIHRLKKRWIFLSESLLFIFHRQL